jgi:hypothetical protein
MGSGSVVSVPCFGGQEEGSRIPLYISSSADAMVIARSVVTRQA